MEESQNGDTSVFLEYESSEDPVSHVELSECDDDDDSSSAGALYTHTHTHTHTHGHRGVCVCVNSGPHVKFDVAPHGLDL